MNLKVLSICILLAVVRYVKPEDSECHIIDNTTASEGDHVLVSDFRNRLYSMVDAVPWHAHVKAWVDVGLIVADKPLTMLMDVANELPEYDDYAEWRHGLWQNLGEKYKNYTNAKMRTYVRFFNTHIMNAYRKMIRKKKNMLPNAFNVEYEQHEGDYSIAGDRSG